jgi:uncharacterized protein (TIGR02599 family)
MKTLIRKNSAFTLIEVMVSSALIVVIMGFLMYTMDQTQRTMRGADSKVGQFQTARVAFEAMTRNLSQATVNTYWDLDFGVKNGKVQPVGYRRNSDLHFVSGVAASQKILNSTEIIDPTHAIFFQAPLGVSYQDDHTEVTATGYAPVDDNVDPSQTNDDLTPKRKYRFLNGLLNVCGYYIHWGADPRVPTFLKQDLASDKINRRYRYRLTEVTQPTETVTVFNNPWYTRHKIADPKTRIEKTFNASPNDGARSRIYENATDWIKVAIGQLSPTLGPRINYSRPLADNIVAMIVVPKLPESDRKGGDKTRLDDLTTDYEYDSRPQSVYNASFDDANPSFRKGTAQIQTLLSDQDPKREYTQYAQLPPILQVTLVAIDEDSGAKLESSLGTPENGPPIHWANGLFKTLNKVTDFTDDLGDPADPESTSLLGRLSGRDRSLRLPKMNYRIFTTDVVMRAAKWSNPN